jgi:hypothetical protein
MQHSEAYWISDCTILVHQGVCQLVGRQIRSAPDSEVSLYIGQP